MPSESRTTLMIMVDALRHDYVNPTDAPYLSSLAERSTHGALVEPLTYNPRPIIFEGKHPEESNICNMFCFDPPRSPFGFTRWIPRRLTKLPGVRTRYRRWYRGAARRLEARRGHTASAAYADTASIPTELLKYFSYSETRISWGEKTDSLFGLLEKRGQRWAWLAYPFCDQRTLPLLDQVRKTLTESSETHRLIFLHFAELDWVGHKHGPGSAEQKVTMSAIDRAIQEVISLVHQRYDEVNGVIFGDHGMEAVSELIDVSGTLRKTGLRLEKDYIYFLDSTQARFWFMNDRAREVVVDALAGFDSLHRITDADRERLRVRFPDRRYGDLVYTAKAGAVVYPNFFQRKSPPAGMHGYMPDVTGNWAKFIVFGEDVPTKPVKSPVDMIRLHPTLLELLDAVAWDSGEASILELDEPVVREEASRPRRA